MLSCRLRLVPAMWCQRFWQPPFHSLTFTRPLVGGLEDVRLAVSRSGLADRLGRWGSPSPTSCGGYPGVVSRRRKVGPGGVGVDAADLRSQQPAPTIGRHGPRPILYLGEVSCDSSLRGEPGRSVELCWGGRLARADRARCVLCTGLPGISCRPAGRVAYRVTSGGDRLVRLSPPGGGWREPPGPCP